MVVVISCLDQALETAVRIQPANPLSDRKRFSQ